MRFNNRLRVCLITMIAMSAVACSDDVTNIYQDPPAQAQDTHTYIHIPAGVWLDGVNDVNFYSTVEGLVMQSEDTSAKTWVTAGGFNGGGTGNKAYVGFNQYGGQLVSSLSKLEFTARLDRGTSFSFINMQVDCDGDGNWVAGTDAVVVVDANVSPSASLTFDLDGTFKTYVIKATDPVFKSVGAVCGLPLHTSHTGLALSALPATAKFFNGLTTDGGMPRATNMAAILFLMNDSSAKVSRQVTLREFVVNDTRYTFSQSH